MTFAVTSLYAGLLALVFLALSVRTIAVRRAARVPVGDGGNKLLLRRMRAHGNFAEYVPIALILLALAEAGGAHHLILHAVGLALLVGRSVHGFNIAREDEAIPLRVLGMSLTFTAIGIGAVVNLVLGIGLL